MNKITIRDLNIRKATNFISYRMYDLYYAFAKRQVRKRNVIWLFCTPKSASSFLHLLISELFSFRSINTRSPLPYGRDRFHEPSPFRMFHSNPLSLNKYTFSGHLHTMYSEFLEDHLLGSNHVVIVQTRSILDTLVSLYDFIPKGRILPFVKISSNEWGKLAKVERYDYLIQHYIPWHIDFLISWLAQDKHEIYIVDYAEITKNTNQGLKDILKFINLDLHDGKIAQVIKETLNLGNEKLNKNKGVVGRGLEELTTAQIEKIHQMISVRSKSGIDLYKYV